MPRLFAHPSVRPSVHPLVGTWVAQPWLPSLALSARRAVRGVPTAHGGVSGSSHGVRAGALGCAHMLLIISHSTGVFAQSLVCTSAHSARLLLTGALEWNYQVSPSDPMLCAGLSSSSSEDGPLVPTRRRRARARQRPAG